MTETTAAAQQGHRLAAIAAILTAALLSACGTAPDAAENGAGDTASAQSAQSSGPGACAVLPESVWLELVGKVYYGPQESTRSSGNSTISSCQYNATELELWRPAPVGGAAAMRDRLERFLSSTAAEDRKNGMNWTVSVEAADGLGAPAVLGIVSDEPLSVFYIHALAADGSMVTVRGADDERNARDIAQRVLEHLGR